jgi:Ca2+-binding EF-hand superfamily protein
MIAIGKLRLAIEKYQIDKKELFSRYDKNNADSLSLHEFTRMIKKIDDKLVSEEIELAFKKFDTSSTGKITFA